MTWVRSLDLYKERRSVRGLTESKIKLLLFLIDLQKQFKVIMATMSSTMGISTYEMNGSHDAWMAGKSCYQ